MWGRDWKKDDVWKSKNAWCLNLNMDMLEKVGYHQQPTNGPPTPFSDLTQHDKLPEVCSACCLCSFTVPELGDVLLIPQAMLLPCPIGHEEGAACKLRFLLSCEAMCFDLVQIIGYLKIWLDGNAEVDGTLQRTPHVRSTLNYIRMGFTGYNNDDPSHYSADVDQKCRDYRSAIATIVNAINGNVQPPSRQKKLWDNPNGIAEFNDERIGIDVPWC